jgi:hypothetical protein
MTYDEFKNVLDLPNINSTEYIAIVVKDFNGNKQEFADFFFKNSSNSTKSFIKLNNGSVYMILNQDVVLNENIVYESVTDLPEPIVSQESDS